MVVLAYLTALGFDVAFSFRVGYEAQHRWDLLGGDQLRATKGERGRHRRDLEWRRNLSEQTNV
jgi:hypothetical protein